MKFKLSNSITPERLAFGLGSSAALLGLLVMAGWHFKLPRLIQILPTSAPMQYNTALAFLLCGSCIIFTLLGWRKTGLLLSALATLIAALTLLEYCFGFDLGLDQLIVKSTLMYQTSHPGRMSPLTALCFVLLGVALKAHLLFRRESSRMVTVGFVAAMLALCASSLIVYATGLADPLNYFQLSRMAVHTALGFLLLAAAIYALLWEVGNVRSRWTQQILIPLTVCLLTATCYFWASLQAQEQANIRREAGLLATVVKNGMEVRSRSAGQALMRMAQRWNLAGGTPRRAWEADAANYVRDYESALAVVWANQAHQVQWIVPLQGNEAVQGYDLGSEARQRAALERAQDQNAFVVSQLVELFQNGKGILLIAPVFRQGRSDGHLLLGSRLSELLAIVAKRHLQNGDVFALLAEQAEIARFGETENTGAEKYQSEVVVDLVGTRVRLVVTPGQARIARARTMLPSVFFWGGLLVSLLVGLLTHQSQHARLRARKLDTMVEQLVHEEERFRTVVEATPSALLCLDSTGKVLLANTQAEQLFGYTRQELLGMSGELLRSESSRGQLVEARASYLRHPYQKAFGELEGLYGRRKDGSEFPLEFSLNPIVWLDGMAVLVSVNDITERKQVEQALRDAKESAEQATRTKSLFLASMSHEIRTPMNGVIGMAELLRTTPLTATQQEYVEIIQASGESLLLVINDILDFSKIEAGKLDLEIVDFDLRDVIEGARKLFTEPARRKRLALTVQMDSEVSTQLHGDPTRLRQVLINLISNAIKFTEQGEVSVRVRLLEETTTHATLRLSVADTGIGILPDAQAQLFQAFTQADDSVTRKYGGTGLGLVISARLVEIMRGNIGFDSAPGKGSVFWFTITLEKQAARSWPAALAEPPAPYLAATEVVAAPTLVTSAPAEFTNALALSAGPARVLIAEDHPVNQQVVRSQVEKLGYQSEVVSNGREALLALNREAYALVLMDCQMPVMDGLAATAAIRQLTAPACHTPIIAVTANAMRGEREKCLAAGMNDYLSKPFKHQELAEIIQRWVKPAQPPEPQVVSGSQSAAQPLSTAQQPAAGRETENTVKLRLAELRRDYGNELVTRIIDMFLPDTAQRLSQFPQLIAQGDIKMLEREAHALKGACGNFGALRMMALSETLETQAEEGELHNALALSAQLMEEFRRLKPLLEAERQAAASGD